MRAPDPSTLKFDEQGLIVAVAQDSATGTVLMLAYMNRQALARTIETGEAHFWSRSRKELWHKGETSGNVLSVERIQADCDGDALLLSVRPSGPACHLGRRACFSEPATVLDHLDATLLDRFARRPAGSYTAQLFNAGRSSILRKIGEEAIEVLLAGQGDDADALKHEVADLWFHSCLLLTERGLSARDVLTVLAQRRKGNDPTAGG